jgi:hypothetical protein
MSKAILFLTSRPYLCHGHLKNTWNSCFKRPLQRGTFSDAVKQSGFGKRYRYMVVSAIAALLAIVFTTSVAKKPVKGLWF